MHLYFRAKIQTLRLTVLEAFEVAYVWRFGKPGNVVPDYCEYVQHGILPLYVRAWVKDLQAKES